MSNQVDPSVAFVLGEYEREKMYGTVEVRYENGRVVLIKKSETLKPASRDNRAEGEDER